MTPFFSVLIVTYNSDWDKTRQTLYSVLSQKNTDIQIVIADDGSNDNSFEKIRQYFRAASFTNYYLVENKRNQGTVKNILSALPFCKGNYIKPLSPGDFLYNDTTLYDFMKFIDKQPATVYFGNMFYYSINADKSITVHNKKNPRDLRPWKNRDMNKVRWNYLVYRDYICGAGVIYNTDKFRQYLALLADSVVFAEDMTIVYMIANNEPTYYINGKGGIWYEYGSGISTQKKADGRRTRLSEDIRNTFTHIFNDGLISEWLYKMHFSENKTESRILRIIHAPNSCFFKFFKPSVKGYDGIDFDLNELRMILMQ